MCLKFLFCRTAADCVWEKISSLGPTSVDRERAGSREASLVFWDVLLTVSEVPGLTDPQGQSILVWMLTIPEIPWQDT